MDCYSYTDRFGRKVFAVRGRSQRTLLPSYSISYGIVYTISLYYQLIIPGSNKLGVGCSASQTWFWDECPHYQRV